MISFETSTVASKMTDRSVVATCSFGISLRGTGLSAAALPVLPGRVRSERPTEAPAVTVAAKAQSAYGLMTVANGAGAGTARGGFARSEAADGQQKNTQHGKWAFRGLEPWSDPA